MVDTIAALYADEDVMGAFADWFEFTRDCARETILSTKAIQLTCLGVADNFQSCETTQNYLVDPDNRRPADVGRSPRWPVSCADAIRRPGRGEVPPDLAILRLRRRRPDAFVGAAAAYSPLPSSSGHVVSFARGADQEVVVVASRLARPIEAAGGSAPTPVLPEGRWFDVLTSREYEGGSIEFTTLLDRFPCGARGGFRRRGHHHDAGRDGPDRAAPRRAGGEAGAAGAEGGLLGWLTRRLSGKDAIGGAADEPAGRGERAQRASRESEPRRGNGRVNGRAEEPNDG